MAITNLNDLAKTITEKEGKNSEVNIAQVKEILKITLHELADMDRVQIAKLLKRYESKKKA